MRKSQKLTLEASELRGQINVFNSLEKPSDEQRTAVAATMKRADGLEIELRAAITVEAAEDSEIEKLHASADSPENRERVELRSKALLGRYLTGHGRTLTGAERELSEAAGVGDGAIPLELWDVPDTRQGDRETRAVTDAPATVGLNLDPLQPQIFAPSIASALRVDMPSVESGTFATGTITGAATADAVAKGAAVPETAAAFTVQSTTPHRVGASLNLAAEDVAAVGQANFESLLREHISMVLSDALDGLLLNGDSASQADETLGMFARLTDPEVPAAGVSTWSQFLSLYGSGIDGKWATTVADVSMILGLATYRHALMTYRAAETDLSVVAYGRAQTGGMVTNARMPAVAAHVQQGLLIRRGHPAMRAAVAPTWGSISVDDAFTGALKAERRFVISVLIGDLILVQPSVYTQTAMRVSI